MDGFEVLHNNIKELPDYIFLDLNMPLMDGKSFLKKIKKDEGLKDIPIIVYTTSDRPKDRTDTIALGADYFLTKPTSYQMLCKKIVEAVDGVGQKKK